MGMYTQSMYLTNGGERSGRGSPRHGRRRLQIREESLQHPLDFHLVCEGAQRLENLRYGDTLGEGMDIGLIVGYGIRDRCVYYLIAAQCAFFI